MPQYDEATFEQMGQRTWRPFETPYGDATFIESLNQLHHDQGLECLLDALAAELPWTWSLGRGQTARFDHFRSRAKTPRGVLNPCICVSFRSFCSKGDLISPSAVGTSVGTLKAKPIAGVDCSQCMAAALLRRTICWELIGTDGGRMRSEPSRTCMLWWRP